MSLSAGADTRHLAGRSTQAANETSSQIAIYQQTHTHTHLGTPRDNRGERSSEVPWNLSAAGSAPGPA